MNHDVKVVHPLDDDVLGAGCWGVCTGAVVTALSYRPRALLPPASHASLTAAPMLVAVAAARSSRSLYVVYAAYPCFICAKDGIVLMVHLRYVSGTMMRVWNGPNHGHHRPCPPRVVKDTILRAVPSGFFSYTRLPPVNISIDW